MDLVQVNEFEPSWRKPFGVFLILLLIIVWAVIVASVAELMEGLPWPVFVPYYLVAGVVWILPLKPLLRWIETGSFRAS
jgi:carbon starvation protein CstA